MVYADSFESLPRPPPPADADYSPPDISPDDSSETRGRVRNKLQRLPTFIERQEAWQRKTWNQYGGSSSKANTNSAAMSAADSVASIAESWPLHDQNDQDQEQLRRYWRSRSQEDALSFRSTGDALAIPPPPHYASSSAVSTSSNCNGNIKCGNGSTANPAIYWHDWLPPPAALIDCGCGLCRLSVSMNKAPLSTSKSSTGTAKSSVHRHPHQKTTRGDLPVHPPPVPPQKDQEEEQEEVSMMTKTSSLLRNKVLRLTIASLSLLFSSIVWSRRLLFFFFIFYKTTFDFIFYDDINESRVCLACPGKTRQGMNDCVGTKE